MSRIHSRNLLEGLERLPSPARCKVGLSQVVSEREQRIFFAAAAPDGVLENRGGLEREPQLELARGQQRVSESVLFSSDAVEFDLQYQAVLLAWSQG